MKRLRSLVLMAVVLAAFPAWTWPGEAPVALRQARFVAIGLEREDRVLAGAEVHADPSVLRAERKALEDVRAAIEKWGRYEVVDHVRQADLLVAIRPARVLSLVATVTIGGGGRDASGTSRQGLGAAASSPVDTIRLYEVRDGEPGTLWWWKERRGGLEGPSPTFVEDLRVLVEKGTRTP
jgi:hypothetical protein